MTAYRFLSAGGALLAGSLDWQPLILALAALIVAATPAAVGLLVSLRNNAAIARVEVQTNSHLTILSAQIAALQKQVSDQQAIIVAQAGAKGAPG